MADVGRQADEVHEPRGVFVVCDVGLDVASCPGRPSRPRRRGRWLTASQGADARRGRRTLRRPARPWPPRAPPSRTPCRDRGNGHQVDALSDCRGPHVFDAEDVRLVIEYLEANERARLAEYDADKRLCEQEETGWRWSAPGRGVLDPSVRPVPPAGIHGCPARRRGPGARAVTGRRPLAAPRRS